MKKRFIIKRIATEINPMQISSISRVGGKYVVTMAHGGTLTITPDEKKELDAFGEEHDEEFKARHDQLKPLFDIFRDTTDKEALKTKVSEFIDKM